ncbi:hypothetical protein CEN46_18190 [Fischerella thermalis CCMEE 5318]|uniref:Uncharacterized protein n=2 Tax=Fischerella TaxID=1190 RepID=A0A2N6LAU8_9CYAN|nr:hypothetical protein CEN46_18190 [Fischerella thermalis CCMEE 5318]
MRTQSLDKMIRELPPEAQRLVRELVEYLRAMHAVPRSGGLQFTWEGALESLRDRYTSVQLQHEILREWTGEVPD